MKMNEKTGVFICDCGGTQFLEKDTSTIGCRDIFRLSTLCTEPELSSLANPVREQGFSRIVFAGCSPVGNRELLERIAQRAGLAPSAVYGVNIRQEGSAEQAISAINRGIHALELMPSFQVKSIPLDRGVLIIGGGIAGIQTAAEIAALGYDITLVESSVETGIPELPQGVKVYTGSRLLDLSGHVGSFKAGIHTPDGDKHLTCGAVVLAAGIIDIGIVDSVIIDNPLHNSNFMVSMSELEGTVSHLRRKNGMRPIGLILDISIEETKASMETALKLCLKLQKRGSLQIHLFCREVRVAAPGLEKLYDEAREAGANIVKYEGRPSLNEGEDGVSITCRDSILQEEISLHCDFVGISTRGIASAADSTLARITGVSLDSLGQMQDNNIHLFPEQTNRPGIFVVGSCRGQDYIPRIITEAKAAALAVHSLLQKGSVEIELSSAVVDADKCILCLTCIRSCPFQAMQVDREKGAAMSIPEACQKCGICAGECPAKAIELPVFSNQILLSQVEMV